MARRCMTLSLPDFDVVVSYRFLLFVIWVVFNESLQCIIHGMLLRKKTIVQWRDLLVDSSVNRGCYKNVSDGIVKTSIIRHLDASYQVSVHLAEGFQRRRLKCERLTDDGWQTTDAKWWQKVTLPLARWAKNVSDGIGKTSIIRHLVLLLSLLCVLLLSHFVAGNKVHGWIFKIQCFMIYCVHALFIACTCILCCIALYIVHMTSYNKKDCTVDFSKVIHWKHNRTTT
jgi:hypothetical protein